VQKPQQSLNDLQKIFSKFFVPENIPADAAMAQLANPRAPEVAFPYRRTAYIQDKEPAVKRARKLMRHTPHQRQAHQRKQQQVS
jgi:hypothetical protein